jgi:CheY-like chemotaxis protein
VRYARGMIVIADDCPISRLVLARELDKRALPATYVASLAAGRALRATVDCALVDLDLGDGSGADLATHLRSQAPGLPIAFFTASTDTTEAQRHGPVFRKPEQLAEAIAWIAAHAAAATVPPEPRR